MAVVERDILHVSAPVFRGANRGGTLPIRHTADDWSIQMMIPVATLALATQLSFTIADDVPQFNLEPTCRGIAQQSGLDLQPDQSTRQDYQSCMQSEMAVRDQLVKQWSTYKASDKANCISGASVGGLASYTGLLTCLQMATEANKIGR